MQPETPQTKSTSADLDNTQCPNCQAVLPRGLRFCRACGYRLGEGLEEYVETVRLKPRVSAEQRPAGTTDAPQGQQTSPFQPRAWGAMAGSGNQAAISGLQKDAKFSCAKRRKSHWMLWMIIAIVVLSVTGGGLLTPFALRAGRGRGAAAVAAKKSFFGVSGFRSADGGASFDYVTPPGSPADKAGLVGGDVIISYDGQPVKNADDMRKLLDATPVGKTVDVVFLRDGQRRTVQMTTITKEEGDRLSDDFDEREKGYLKEGSDIDRVIVPGMNIYGVRLNKIGKSGPADIAGIKDGDIVIEFDGIPTRTRRELENRIERAQPYSTVPVVLIRDGQRMEIQVKVGVEP